MRVNEPKKNKTPFFNLKNIKKLKGLPLIISGLAAGLLLFAVGSIPGMSPENKNAPPAENNALIPAGDNINVYIKLLEDKTAEIISGIKGVAGVRVMITLDSIGESEYVTDVSEKKTENAGGTASSERSGETVKMGASDRSQSPVLAKQIQPKVRGVAVVCGGAGDPQIKAQIITLVSAVFGLPTNKICVLEGKE